MNTIIIRYEGLSPTWSGDAVTGQIGTLRCSFSFDERWNEYDVKYMVVTKDNRPFEPIPLDKDDSAEVPEIALLERSFLKIGAVGLRNKDGELLRYNGRPCKILVDQGNLIPDPDMEPDESESETAYEQILMLVGVKLDKNQGTENAGRAMVVDEDGYVRPGEYDCGGIKKESDPTVPNWAKQPKKPTYTPQEIGALPDSTKIPTKTSDLQNDSKYITVAVASLLNYYLKSETYAKGETYSQTEVDELISGLDKRLNALVDSDDDTLDQLSEIVEYIKANKGLIDSITTSKVSVADIVDNLTTNVSDKPLSAAQGVALKKLIDGLSTGKLDANKLPEAINTALAQAKKSGEFDGEDGEDGTSVTVSSVKESTEDGGNNVVTFSDGKTLNVKNGKTGAAGDPGKSAFAYAQDGGYTGTEEEFAEKLASESGGVDFTTDETLTLQNGVLSVNTAAAVEEDNTRPITSAAVFQTVGNIEILLKTI